jgi:hypothetical protein
MKFRELNSENHKDRIPGKGHINHVTLSPLVENLTDIQEVWVRLYHAAFVSCRSTATSGSTKRR